MKIVKNTLVSLAAASFLLAQPAAAATRSYQSLPTTGIQQPVTADRAGSPVADAEAGHGSGNALIILLVFGGLLALFAAAGLFGHGKDSTG
jgi:hypothetical protein